MAVMSPLAATLSMQQPIIPASKAQIAPTDVLGAYNSSLNQANTQYLAKLQQQNSLWGGLAGLGGSALTASILKGKLFGTPAATATTGAAPTAAGAASPVASTLTDSGGFAGVPLAGLAPPVADTGAAAGVPLAGLAPPAAAADAAFAGVPLAGLDASTIGAGTDAAGTAAAGAGADAATVAGADAAATAAAGAGADATAGAGMTLADLLPFLFAA